ncbi:hypothetical protein LSAT2_032311 [Lamellibrachia satsuma]|nr:hypothetical protein LSAT2_032311 [Lamellibrachia satsuma]
MDMERFTGTPTRNGVVTMGNNEATPLLPDSLLGGFTQPNESRKNETIPCDDIVRNRLADGVISVEGCV